MTSQQLSSALATVLAAAAEHGMTIEQLIAELNCVPEPLAKPKTTPPEVAPSREAEPTIQPVSMSPPIDCGSYTYRRRFLGRNEKIKECLVMLIRRHAAPPPPGAPTD